jgi:adenine-specific DNA-methyltransferase
MEKITKENPLSQSKNIISENLEQLKVIFPQIFKEGKIDKDELLSILGDNVEPEEEYYRFTWAGKSMARREANKPSTATLRPDKQSSKDWDTTQNIFIEGDNLEVLKLLQKSYTNKIKMIYIDPPYNTGKDFVYKDNYNDNLSNYLAITGQVDEDGKRINTNSESDGRYHSNWLNMMYPRLKLARNLLKDDGVIFISIDDNEEDNLKKVCSEIFGEENLIANIIWRKKYGIQNDAKYFSTSHEYLLCLTKNSSSFTPNLLDRTDEQNNRYKNPDNDTRGPWKSGDLSVGRTTEKDIYEIITPSGRRVLPPEGSSWRISKEKFQEYIKDYRIWFGETGNNVPSIKRFLSEVKQGITPTTFWDYDEVGHTDGSNKYLKSLFEGKQYFDYPKPVEYISKAIKIGTGENDIVLDFFAGSGTTAEAVLQLNSEDAGNRKFICVQLPEPTDEKSEAYKAGYMTISEITKERIRRAGDKIKSEMKEDLFSQQGKTLDIGFRAFKLASSNIRAWDGNPDALEDNLFNAESNIKENRTEEDVLYEILLKYGLDLTMPIEKKLIAGKQVFNIGLGALFICLGDNITTAVAEGIGKWKEELQPATTKVIFKDIGFTDVEKTNSMQILKRYGILEVNTI